MKRAAPPPSASGAVGNDAGGREPAGDEPVHGTSAERRDSSGANRFRLRSFRLRITLMSTATALAAILILFVAASTTIVARRAQILDHILSAHLSGPGFSVATPALWPAIDAHLNASFSAFAPQGSQGGYAILRASRADGSLVYRSPSWPTALDTAALPHAPGLHTVADGALEWRLGQVRHGDLTVWVGVNRSLSNAQLRVSLWRFAAAAAVLGALIALLAWYLSARAMRPVEHLTGVMLGLNASDLDQRVAADEEDIEFAQLVTVFNAMLDRLQRSFLQAIRFSGDAAHELKTPLTILQGQLEHAFTHAAKPEQEEALVEMLEEVRRLDSIVRKLLMLSRADAGQLQIPLSPFDLRPVLDELAEDIELLDAERDVRLDLPLLLMVQGDADLLRQVLQNLASNAVKYGLPGGWIGLSARQHGGHWQIDVSNASSGIAAEHRERLFDRFYRADHAHNRRIPGVGLGLSLAREIARAHGGELLLAEADQKSTCFRLCLPAER
ncbi:ATP-binding protein [Massilia sp. MB5]|uniref:ATP-binding protein n=1 Tax=Massilia sp. MB5 TaxID=2919578 RepID=UPI001F0E3C37|nr:ATP-binding protein [Massilia sp. MB5]UMR30884.1 ATP-binding protein [Massilia sp. MB5]